MNQEKSPRRVLDLPDDQSLPLLQASLESTFDSILVTDADLEPPGPRIMYANAAFAEMTGYSVDEVIGANPRFLQGPNTDRAVLDRLRRNLQAGESFSGQAINYHRDGTPLVLEWRVTPIRDTSGAITNFVATQRDVTERVTTARHLAELAHYDGLTSLANRQYTQSLVEAEIERATRYEVAVSVALFDIDQLKAINDHGGHRQGDKTLVQFAALLRSRLRTNDLAGRWGGNEFLVVLPHTDVDAAFEVAEDLREQVATMRSAQPTRFTVSCGIAQHEAGETAQAVCDAADIALYEAKSLGQNRVMRAPTRIADPPSLRR